MLPTTVVLLVVCCLLAGSSGTAKGGAAASPRWSSGRGADARAATERSPPETSAPAVHRPRPGSFAPASRSPPPPVAAGSDVESSRGRAGKPTLIEFNVDYDEEGEVTTPVPRRQRPTVAVIPRPPDADAQPWRPPLPDRPPVIIESSDGGEEESSDGGGGGGQNDDGKRASPAPPREPKICDYDPCRHGQKPCIALQQESGCRCAGIVRDKIPDAPTSPEVTFVDELTAEVSWCAPESEVADYYLRYREAGDAREHRSHGIHATWRRFALRDLASAARYELCVVAANALGESECKRVAFETPRSHRKAVVGCALAAFVALLAAVVALAARLCHRRRCRGRNRALITRRGHGGNGGDLVSAQNPVFADDFAKVDQVVRLDFGTYGKA